MKHDPMCPMTTPDGYLCCCNLIARVREDERKQYAAKWYSQQELDAAVAAAREDERGKTIVSYDLMKQRKSYEQGQRDEREAAAQRVIKQGVSIVAGRPAAREAVDALTHDAPCDCGTCRAIAADRLTRGKEGNRG